VESTFRLVRISATAILALAALLIAGTSVAWPAPTALAAVASCDSLKTLSLENAVIDSASIVSASAIAAAFGSPATQVPATCRVHATVSHPGANDRIGVDIWMPVVGWNGRFVGIGGGGYAGGFKLRLSILLEEEIIARIDGRSPSASSKMGAKHLSGDTALRQREYLRNSY
jgi:hypothetical protein